MDKLETATGKTYDCDYFNRANPIGQLHIRVLNASIIDVAMTFSDPSETALLMFGGSYVSNYVNVVAIIQEGNAIRVVLNRR
jgi:hypothetical protein